MASTYHNYQRRMSPHANYCSFSLTSDSKTNESEEDITPESLPAESPRRDECEDITSKIIGDFGKWQLQISILMALLKLPSAWYQLTIIFLAPPQQYWCAKPPSFNNYTDAEWRSICSPVIEEHPCLIFDPEPLSANPNIDRSKLMLVECKRFVYDRSVFNSTIVSEWDLVCGKHWLIHLSQCVMMVGILLGGVFVGAMADKYGRKKPLIAAIVVQSVTSATSGLLPNFWLFVLNRFILAIACGGLVIVSFVISMEAVSGKWRTIVPVLSQLPFGLGNSVMAGVSYWLRDWRNLEFGLAFLSSFYILYAFWVTESPRWLLATSRTEEALEVLKYVAKKNGRPFHPDDIEEILRSKKVQRNLPKFSVFIKLKNMRMKTILLCLNWFCTGLAYYTFSQYLGFIGQDIFMTVAISGLISTPGAIVCVIIITRVGRKTTIGFFQVVTGTCFVLILLIPKNGVYGDWPGLVCAGIGMAGMAGSVPALYLFSAELYPTVGRNVGVAGVTTFARVGSMIAPLMVSLEEYLPDMTLILLAAMSFAQLFLLVPLPETKDHPLPETLDAAENFTKWTNARASQTTER